MKKLLLAALAASTAMIGAAQADTTIGNTPTGGSIAPFGVPDSQTYGEVFTAPITGRLTSFTLYLNGGVGALFGGVGTWNGPSTFVLGAGSPTNLYQSADVLSAAGGAYTFSPNVSVVAGQNYVAYLSAFGVAGATGSTTMPLGTAAPSLGYFVWNNTTDPRGNPSWNYFFDAGNAQFDATFSPAPEPATWALMIIGFGAVGVAMRRRSDKVAFA